MAARPDCVMESVEPENDSGADTVVACATPLLLVDRTVAGRSETVRLLVEAVANVARPDTPKAVVVALIKSADTKCEVEDAKTPACAQTGDEVAAVMEL